MKHRRPNRPTRKQSLAAFNAQRPLDTDEREQQRKKRRPKREDDGLENLGEGIGGTDRAKP